jgi:hypothetical protein
MVWCGLDDLAQDRERSCKHSNEPSNLTNTILNIILRPVCSLKNTTFRRLDSVSVFRWKLLRWAQ